MTRRPQTELVKAAIAGAAGLVTLAVAVVLAPWQLAIVVGWCTAATVMLVGSWWPIARLDAAGTHRVATREDDSRTTTRLLLLAACLMSLGAVLVGLHRASRADRPLEIALTIGSMSTVVLSWLLVHTLFMLRYAHLYYGAPQGGIEFPGGDPPSYGDFAYLAFTIGMTFQVSDTAISAGPIRRTATRHALLSYVFGTAIIASTISVLAGLVI